MNQVTKHTPAARVQRFVRHRLKEMFLMQRRATCRVKHLARLFATKPKRHSFVAQMTIRNEWHYRERSRRTLTFFDLNNSRTTKPCFARLFISFTVSFDDGVRSIGTGFLAASFPS